MGRIGRVAETAAVLLPRDAVCCCCVWTDLTPIRCDAGILCTVLACCDTDAGNCAVNMPCWGCLNGNTFCLCWTTVALAFATTLRLAISRICLAADCPPVSRPWSDGRFVPSFTTSLADDNDCDFAGGGAANRRARCSSLCLSSISSALAECRLELNGLAWGWPALPAENLFLQRNDRTLPHNNNLLVDSFWRHCSQLT